MREAAHIRGYDWTWHKLRNAFIESNPLCLVCEREGRITEADEVDHVIPFDGIDDPLRLDESNLQSLCKRHHRLKTLRDEAGIGKLFIVSGPPAAGKTTFVNKAKADNDIVFDFDSVAESLGFKRYEHSSEVIPLIESLRSKVLSTTTETDRWIIYTSHSSAVESANWYKGELIVISEPMEICIQRLKASGRDTALDRVKQWWTEFRNVQDRGGIRMSTS